MEYITLNNGIKMPVVGYGVYQISNSETKECVLNAIQEGYRLIDTAQYYGNEEGVGDALKASGIDRSEFFITTKLKNSHCVERLIEKSLKKLKTDYIDLVLIHWVMGNDLKTYRILEDYYKKGIIKAIGLSNFFGSDYENIVKNCEIKPQVNQIETHVFYQRKDLKELYKENETVMEAWAPFAEGKKDIFNNSVLKQIAQKHQKTTAQVMLRFLIQNEIVAIPKSVHQSRMKENINIFDFELDQDDMIQIETLDQGRTLFHWYE